MAKTSDFVLTQTRLKGLNKKGITKANEDGTYTLVLGAINCHNNNSTRFYTAGEAVRRLFTDGSMLQRRIQNGALRAEVGHPVQKPGESDSAFAARYIDIDLKNTCATIEKVWLDENYGKNHPEVGAGDFIAILGNVRPTGVYGAVLKEQLETNTENCCFSIRSMSEEVIHRGTRYRQLLEVYTFDLVNEGGIIPANKWGSPCTETIDNEMGLMGEGSQVLTRVSESMLREILKPEFAHTTESSRNMASHILNTYFKEEVQRERRYAFQGWK